MLARTLYLLSLFAFAVPAGAQTAAIFSTVPIGFGAAATGGTNPCAAATLDAFRTCAGLGNQLITLSITVPSDNSVTVAPNTTIIGASGAKGRINSDSPRSLEIRDASNIVIRNVVFHNTLVGGSAVTQPPKCASPTIPNDTIRCGVPIVILGDSHDIWIDHNTFSHCGEKCIVSFTEHERSSFVGPYPAGDMITISNNRFANSYFGVAIGVNAGVPEDQLPSNERVTVYGNLFDGVFRRSIRAASGATVHEFNNVVRHWSLSGDPNATCAIGFGPSSVGAAQLRLENNYFIPDNATCADPIETADYAADDGDRGVGMINESGDVGALSTHADPVFVPPYPYTMLSAEQAKVAVPLHAGAH